MRICSVDQCGRIHLAKGFCQMHYFRMYKNGSLSKKEGHTRKNGRKYFAKFKKFEHVIVAENALGKPLPKKAVVHHVNEIPSDNSPTNLIVCPDQKYHILLHVRMRAMAACGNPNWRPCSRCTKYDDLGNMKSKRNQYYHATCEAEYQREWALKNKARLTAYKHNWYVENSKASKS
jgi:hypothetical protein